MKLHNRAVSDVKKNMFNTFKNTEFPKMKFWDLIFPR
jgi:hypothetical protein